MTTYKFNITDVSNQGADLEDLEGVDVVLNDATDFWTLKHLADSGTGWNGTFLQGLSTLPEQFLLSDLHQEEDGIIYLHFINEENVGQLRRAERQMQFDNQLPGVMFMFHQRASGRMRPIPIVMPANAGPLARPIDILRGPGRGIFFWREPERVFRFGLVYELREDTAGNTRFWHNVWQFSDIEGDTIRLVPGETPLLVRNGEIIEGAITQVGTTEHSTLVRRELTNLERQQLLQGWVEVVGGTFVQAAGAVVGAL